jgi:hypothetical protein
VNIFCVYMLNLIQLVSRKSFQLISRVIEKGTDISVSFY